jgi:hypothetical protein
VKVRIVRLNGAGIDLSLFQFDYDLTWAAIFMNAHGATYARYGTRRDTNAEGMLSLPGLKRVMEKVLEAHKTGASRKPAASTPKMADSFASLPPDLKSGKNCMHCHQIYDHQRKESPAAFDKKKTQELYPLPENLGMTFDRDLGNVVESVDAKGAAAKAGVKEKDEILTLNGTPVYSAGDASWALQNHKSGAVKLELKRGAERKTVTVSPTGDWRVRDISWRGSMWGLRPATGFGGKMLDDAELQKVGLKAGAWAIRVNYIVDWGGDDNPAGLNAKKAGLQRGDIVVSVAGKSDFKTELEFQTWYRLTLKPGTDIEIGVLRNGRVEKLKVPVAG